jgi:hypothetical protein
MDAADPLHKRRGRKPVDTVPDTMKKTVKHIIKKTDNTDNDACAEKEKKKRGRKPKSVYTTNDTPIISSNSCLSDDENVIVRLSVPDDNDSDCSEHPHAYNYNNDQYNIMEYNETFSKEDTPVHDMNKNDGLKVVDILKDFEEKNKNNEWPTNTSICCYWCCHNFDNAPFGIPVSYSNGNFDVYGCFCSLECAAAYNFKSTESLDEIWERYNLINLLSRKINYGRIVKPAPDRLTLKTFGGFLDIKNFRNYNNTNKIVNINFPPMTSLTQQIEEINEYELNSDLKYIPIDSERINRCKENMIFKRNKPIINEKATLKSSMNLTIS